MRRFRVVGCVVNAHHIACIRAQSNQIRHYWQMWSRASKTSTDTDARLDQLRVVHAELNRQRDATSIKHQTMYQRAGLLIGAASVVTGVQSARIPGAIRRLVGQAQVSYEWNAEITLSVAALGLAILACAAAITAAIYGMRTLWAERGSEIDVEKFAVNALESSPDLYATEWSLLADKLGVHVEDNKRLEAKLAHFSDGAKVLVVAWIIAILQFAVSF